MQDTVAEAKAARDNIAHNYGEIEKNKDEITKQLAIEVGPKVQEKVISLAKQDLAQLKGDVRTLRDQVAELRTTTTGLLHLREEVADLRTTTMGLLKEGETVSIDSADLPRRWMMAGHATDQGGFIVVLTKLGNEDDTRNVKWKIRRAN
jgi:hypothetical protein